MALHTLPFALEGVSAHPGTVLRNFVASTFGAPAAAFTNAVQATTAGGSHGVVGAGDFAVTQNGTPNMSVNVAVGRAVVRFGNASSLGAGASTIFNDATTNVAIAAADPTNPRIDLVVIQLRSATEYGEAANDARFFVIQGTPAASPAVPALTSAPNCLVLAQVAVAAATTTIVTANITDKRTRASAVGGIQPVTTATRGTGASLAEGVFEYDLDTNDLIAYSGSAFSTIGPVHGALKTWTPTLSQAASITKTVNHASWGRIGRMVFAQCELTVTGTGSAGSGVKLTLPVTPKASVNPCIGTFGLYDVSATTFYHGMARWLDASGIVAGFANGQVDALGISSFTAALAVNDSVYLSVMYEAAGDA